MTGLLSRLPTVHLAVRNLRRARARTLLATLGIVIGVVAIASLGNVGVAFERSQLQRVSDATTLTVVEPGEDATFETLDRDHVERIRRTTDEAVYPVKSTTAHVSHLRRDEQLSVKSLARPERLFTAERGRIPAQWRDGALVGHEAAADLDVAPGESLTVAGETYHVRAVLAETQSFGPVSRPNQAVFLPPGELDDGYAHVAVQSDHPTEVPGTTATLESELNARKERFAVRDFTAELERFRRQADQINTFLLGVGGISLFVAGVSILNVMLMSVMERREEIGVLRAVGYHRLDVLRLLLTEALVLGVSGAVVGTALSVGVGVVINETFLGDPLAFTDEAIRYTVAGFVFGVGASLVSGVYPAWKAASARPVEALRD
jgi:putative ABC transport system permease protein